MRSENAAFLAIADNLRAHRIFVKYIRNEYGIRDCLFLRWLGNGTFNDFIVVPPKGDDLTDTTKKRIARWAIPVIVARDAEDVIMGVAAFKMQVRTGTKDTWRHL